jgi:hypothetical protein
LYACARATGNPLASHQEDAMFPTRIAFWTIVLVCTSSYLAAQPPSTVKLIATTGMGYVDTIFFGVHQSATPCIDSDLGEYELPPCPPTNVFDMRFINPQTVSSECYGLGTVVDLRPAWDPSVVDTFRVRFQPGDGGYPITFTWRGLRGMFPCMMTLRDPFGGILVNMDMRAESTLAVQAPLTEFLIITGSVMPGAAALASTRAPHRVGATTAAFAAVIQPNNNPTTAWFEWGGTPSLGNTTWHVPVGAGTLPEFFSQWVTDIYSNPTYYRVVVENDWGLRYGEVRSFARDTQSASLQSMIELSVTSHRGVTLVRSAGVHPNATFCVDSEIGEFFLPPPPAADSFDVRFTDPRNNGISCFDEGLGADFRYLTPAIQVDTFQLTMQCVPADYPLTIAWNTDLYNYVTPSLRMIDAYGGFVYDVDMRTQHFLVVENPLIAHLRIIAGSIGQTLTPFVITAPAEYITGSSAQLRGAANPRGSNTWACFEWGTTAAYGHTTAWQDIGAGLSTILISQTMSSLTPSTTHHFRAVAQNIHGTVFGLDQAFTTLPTVDVEEQSPIPAAFRLYQNYPNPFNPVSTIAFAIPQLGNGAGSWHATSLEVIDLLGRTVATLVDREMEPGVHTVRFNGTGVASGVYLYRLKAGDFVQTRKMVLLR